MLYLILIALLPVVHELGHELTARKFGVSLRWSFEWGKIGSVPIPRFVFDFETDNATARKWIKLAGFLAEGAFAILAGLFLPGLRAPARTACVRPSLCALDSPVVSMGNHQRRPKESRLEKRLCSAANRADVVIFRELQKFTQSHCAHLRTAYTATCGSARRAAGRTGPEGRARR